jgi:hypothetical protein
LGELEQDLATHAIIGVDTAPFIYLWERHPRYFTLSETLFRHLKKPQAQGITSVITLFVTNDRRLTKVQEIRVLLFDDYAV